MSLSVLEGLYVVKPGGISDWVYDVRINLDNQLAAVVGFTERQKEGALFWQVDDLLGIYKKYGYDIENRIKELARDFFIQNIE